MSYQVLARKWRPRDFESLVGQDHVVKALRHALEEKRLHHAYLFTGTRGVGKTTLARILAKCLNCETGITPLPCGKCSACMEIDGGRFVDLLEVDAATNTRVDEMRQLLDTAQYVPTRGRFKVYVIDEVHMLSNSAFNAMLKTLEEPPEHLKFVLATTDPQKIPVTVLSRCLQFNLKQMPRPAIVEHLSRILQSESVPYDKDALPLLARAASGSMRDALSILDQAIAHGAGNVSSNGVREMLGAVDDSILIDLLDAVGRSDAVASVGIADDMQIQSLSFDSALAELARLLLHVSVTQLSPQALGDDGPERETWLRLAAQFDPEMLQLLYQIAVQGRSELSLAPDEYAGFVMTILRMIAFRPDGAASGRQAASAKAAIATEKSKTRSAAVTGSAGDDWAALVMRLPVARNSELARFDGSRVELVVPASMAYLSEKSYQEKLRAAIEADLGRAVTLTVRAGEVRGESAAAVERSERESRRSAALDDVKQDRFVQDLVDLLDAKVIEQSVRVSTTPENP